MEPYFFNYDGNTYEVDFVIEKNPYCKSIFRAKDGKIILNIHENITRERAIQMIEHHKLALSRLLRRNSHTSINNIFIFGESREIKKENGFFTIEGIGSYRNEKEKKQLLTHILKRYIDQRFYKIRDEMMVLKKYTYTIKDMKTRYGSNSRRTYNISLSLCLVHYSYEMIDSVIYHEFAHDYYFDHSANFYKLLLHFCPNYYYLDRRMQQGHYN